MRLYAYKMRHYKSLDLKTKSIVWEESFIFAVMMLSNFAVIVPMANESKDFHPFVSSLINVVDKLGCGKVYFVVDNASKDNTRNLCSELSSEDNRFETVWAPENKTLSMLAAGIQGGTETPSRIHYWDGCRFITRSRSVAPVLQALNETNASSKSFLKGGSARFSLEKNLFSGGTLLSTSLGTNYRYDFRLSGFFMPELLKNSHITIYYQRRIYQTELRYLLRNTPYRNSDSLQISIHGVSEKSFTLLSGTFHYFFLRLRGKAPCIT